MAGLDLELVLKGFTTDPTTGIRCNNGDFIIRDGKFNLIAEDDLPKQVGQRLHVRLLLRRGEVFFNTNAGFPYADLSKFKRSAGIFNTYMKSYIIATDGVSKLQRYTSDLDNATRIESVDFNVTIANNQQINVTQEILV